jgi:hypothetical protein
MQIKNLTSSHIEITERVLRAKNGVLMLVRFAVTTIDGRPHIRILSATPVHTLGGQVRVQGTAPLCLPYTCKQTTYHAPQPTSFPFQSPYFSRLDFFTSQMTRAPSRYDAVRV